MAEPQKGKGRSYYTGLVTGAFEFREPYKLNRSIDASGRGAAIMTSKGLLLQRRKRGMGIETGQTETVRVSFLEQGVPRSTNKSSAGVDGTTPGGVIEGDRGRVWPGFD